MIKTESSSLSVDIDLHKTQFTVCAITEEGEYLQGKRIPYNGRGIH